MNTVVNSIYKGTEESFHKMLMNKLQSNEAFSIVTINSEHLQIDNKNLYPFYLSSATTLVADGIGVKLLAKLNKIESIDKITGVSIVKFLLNYANDNSKSVAVLGAHEESLVCFRKFVSINYGNISKINCINGYVKDKNFVLQSYAKEGYDIVLVALGVPSQEILIRDNLHYFKGAVLVGVGGSIDVIGGYKKRAPNFYLKTNTEWLYRIVSEPERISRFLKSNLSVATYSLFNKEKK